MTLPIEIFAKMRDGVQLAMDIYFPLSHGPWPAVLLRTPYLKSTGDFADQARAFAKTGIVFVVQDVRGTGESEGDEYHPYRPDRDDGYDSVEWVAKQEWCTGKVGVTGGSQQGITALFAASSAPPSLSVAYIKVTPHLCFEEALFVGGVFKLSHVESWMEARGAQDQIPALKRRVLWDKEWDSFDLGRHLHQVNIPIYHDAGWYDIFCWGSIRNYIYLQSFGAPGARGRQKLSVGPYAHGPLCGGLSYPGEDEFSLQPGNEELRWFKHWLMEESEPEVTSPAVRYFMMGAALPESVSEANGWQSLSSWPPPHCPVKLYLSQEHCLTQHKPLQSSSIAYSFDPNNPVKTVGGNNLVLDRGPMDQRAIGERQDYLRFCTESLQASVTIAGPVTVKLYVSTTVQDTDFVVKLVDVYPNGYEAVMMDTIIRARYREGRRCSDVRWMTPDKIEAIDIDLGFTAINFERGHRISLHISSSNYPKFEVNDNSGTKPGSERDNRVANTRIYWGGVSASAVCLPVTAQGITLDAALPKNRDIN